MSSHGKKSQPPIEDYAFLSDTQTGALVSRDGSVDWLCFPRFDSPACFAALLGDENNGCWHLHPTADVKRISRRYRPDTMILETEFETASGVVRLIDFMPPRGEDPEIIRIVEGVRGRVHLRMDLTIRFDYGHIVPWVSQKHGGLEAIGGPDAMLLRTPVRTRGHNHSTVAEFTVAKGERVPFVMTWFASHHLPPREVEPEKALRDTERFWVDWANRGEEKGEWREAVVRSLITLKGLTYAPTGGIVAAATTSLPEEIGGVRNWDYRFCWVRDATFTLFALMDAGYLEEARAWREWLLRAVAGSPDKMQIMYGVRGERRLPEFELDWLAGYRKSQPVRIGNAASVQLQLDVYGEALDSSYHAHQAGIEGDAVDWSLQTRLLDFLERNWRKPDEGIWEVRGGRKQFTHSKVMAWVAFDRAVRMVEECGCASDGHLERWKKIRARIHREVCKCGWSAKAKAFTQSYGSEELDASALMMPLVGFLPRTDKRVRSTVEAIERELMRDGFLLRYKTGKENPGDALPGTEGAFLACSFWLADCFHLIGRRDDAHALFQRLLDVRNDLGLLSEEYDPRKQQMLGNFPQAFSHVGLINTARILSAPPDGARPCSALQRASVQP